MLSFIASQCISHHMSSQFRSCCVDLQFLSCYSLTIIHDPVKHIGNITWVMYHDIFKTFSFLYSILLTHYLQCISCTNVTSVFLSEISMTLLWVISKKVGYARKWKKNHLFTGVSIFSSSCQQNHSHLHPWYVYGYSS